MSYIESINTDLLRLKQTDTTLRSEYDKGVEAANKAYELAIEDELYPKLKQAYLRIQTSVGNFIKTVKTQILSLPEKHEIKEFGGKVDIAELVKKVGFAEYSADILKRCNAEMAKITSSSTTEEDIKVIEKLSEYYVEVSEACNKFDEFYYTYIRTKEREQAASDEHNEDLDNLKNELESGLSSAYTTALNSIKKHKATYQQVTDKFLEERFAAQIGKQHTGFPKTICLGAILHPVEDYRRDIVSKALSCNNASRLAVVFEMPLVGSFDNFDTSVNSDDTAVDSQVDDLLKGFSFDDLDL